MGIRPFLFPSSVHHQIYEPFRMSRIKEANFKSLKEGDTVEFDVKGELYRYRFRAVNVKIALG